MRSYDGDSLLTQAGVATLVRSPSTGQLASVAVALPDLASRALERPSTRAWHVDALEQEPLLRKAITYLTPRAWRRCSRVLAHVFVVPAETSYHSVGKFGLLNQALTSDAVRAAIAIFELGLTGWHCLIAGMDQTAAHSELSDRLTLRASRKFCLELLRRIGEESQWDELDGEYQAREEFLASSRVAKVGFRTTRVPR